MHRDQVVLSTIGEQARARAIDKADTYLNWEEMTLVKKQSLELREKKVY